MSAPKNREFVIYTNKAGIKQFEDAMDEAILKSIPTCGQAYEKQNSLDELKSVGIEVNTPYRSTQNDDDEDLS